MKLLSILAFLLLPITAIANEVNLYSAQKEELIRPILEKFTASTGIKVYFTSAGKADLVARLEQEGKNTPADLLMVVDIGNIYQAKEKGLLQPIQSEVLQKQIPQHLRDKENFWFASSLRSRVILYNKNKVKPEEITSYEDLADEKWKGRLLVRSSSNVYNQSLTASMIAHHGEEFAQKWAEGIAKNLARQPQGGDSDQITALAAGEGDIAIANTYYYARLIEEGNKSVIDNVGIIFPNQNDRGVHVNIRGGGVTKYAKNKDNAVKLLEYLVSDEGQSFFAKVNHEYPLKLDLSGSDIISAWEMPKMDQIALEDFAKHNIEALKIMDNAGWK